MIYRSRHCSIQSNSPTDIPKYSNLNVFCLAVHFLTLQAEADLDDLKGLVALPEDILVC